MNLPASLITFLASYLIWLMLLVLIYLWLKGKKALVKRSILTITVAWGIATLLQTIIFSPRPFTQFREEPLVFSSFGMQNSFPSGHAAVASALAFSLLPEEPHLGVVLLVGSLLVDLGRVLALVHYWKDIFGGTVLAFVTSWVIRTMLA